LLDAIDKNGKIRSLGYELVKFPLEPTFAKALLQAKSISKECSYDCAKLVSILSTENIWIGVSKFD
jgi:HrpA-like RNA helicase